jgi:peptidyl-prolyl cis-trans isomerase C
MKVLGILSHRRKERLTMSMTTVCLLLIFCGSFGQLSQAQDQAASTEDAAGAEATKPDAEGGAERDPQVVAMVDGRKILRSDIERRVVGRYGRELENMPAEQNLEARLRAEKASLEELIDRAVLANAAVAGAQFQAREAEVEQRMEQFRTQLPAGSDLNIALDQLGLTEASLREEVRLELAISKLIEQVMAATPDPTSEEVRKYYDERPEFFTKRDKANARHILVSTEGIVDEAQLSEKKAEAEKLRARLVGDSAEDFSAVATAHSDCRSKTQGGRLGEFGRGAMVEEFEEAAFSQEIGQVGPVVKSDFGYHIILVDEREEAGVAPFEEVAATLPDYLKNQRRQEALEDYVRALREKAKIERFL